MVNLYKELKVSSTKYSAPSSEFLNHKPLSIYWLGGFIDGDGSFSLSNSKPRLKFEARSENIR